ncbi:hypothetical protein BGZ58_004052, partial [Dissophora ornata]
YHTSGNKFKAKEFNPPAFSISQSDSTSTDTDPANNKRLQATQGKSVEKKPKISEEQPKAQPKPQKPQKDKIKRDPASKWVRQQLENKEAPNTGRKRNPGNMIGDVLNVNYKTVTLNIGTVGRCLQRGLLNYNTEDCPGLHEHILSTIRGLVRINTDLIRYGSLATFNYINIVMAEHPSINAESKDVEYRKEKLQYIANESQGYFKSLVKVLFYGDKATGNLDYYKSAKSTAELFMAMPGDKKEMIQRLRECKTASSHFLEQIGQTLGDMIRCHIHAFVSELKKRINVWNPEWAESQEGSDFLRTIGDNGKSSVHDAVSVLWVLNTKLPLAKRFAYIPMSAYKDRYCVISEMHLLEALLKTGVEKMFRKGLVKIFGNLEKAKELSQTHPGELFRKLFFYGKKTNYDRQACVGYPNDKSLPHLLDLENLPCQVQLKALETQGPKTEAYVTAKREVKMAIENYILALGADTRAGKYVLTNTLLTDGHQLKIHAYSRVQVKKRSNSQSGSSSGATMPPSINPRNTASCYSTKSKMRYLPALIPNLESLQKEFGDQGSHVVLAVDPGIKNTATAVIADSLAPEKSWNISLSKGCHTWNYQRHNKILRHHKKHKRFDVAGELKSVNDLELMIQPILSIQHDDFQELKQQFEHLMGSYQEYAKSVFAVERELRTFYGSKEFKVTRYRKEQGEKAEVGRAINGMLKVARMRAKIDKRKAMVVIGDGDFKGKNGTPVRANKFISSLQRQKMQTKGRSVLCPDSTCGGYRSPEYNSTHKLDPKTGLQRDRDHNAGQNMANAALKWVKEFKWPEALDRQLAKKQEASCGMMQIHMDSESNLV